MPGGHASAPPGSGPACLGVAVVIFMGLTMKSEAFFLTDIHKIEKHQKPVLFWSLMALLGVIALGLFALGWLASASRWSFQLLVPWLSNR